MEIKISKREHVIKSIDVEFPYYFEEIYSEDESGLYGKIEESSHTIINITYRGDKVEDFYIKRSSHKLSQDSELCEYFEDMYKSTKENYERVLGQVKDFLVGIV